MIDELSFLIKLQSFDAVIDDFTGQAKAFDPLIQAKNQQIESLKTAMKSAKDSIIQLQVKKKELELEADAQEKLVKKHQGELNSLKSNDAYKAMLSEIDAAKKAQSKIEDQILVVMESLEKSDAQLKEVDRQIKADEGRIRGEIQTLEKQKADILTQADAQKTERETFSKTGPAPLFNQYESIRGKRSGVAIVPVISNCCGGCRMNLTQNKIIEVKKAKNMVLCDSCMRILYLPPAEAPAAADATPSQTVPASK